MILTLTVLVYVLSERISYPFSIILLSEVVVSCDSSQELLNFLTVSLSLFLSETAPPPSHGRLHPDTLSQTHTDSRGWWNPTEVSFKASSAVQLWAKNLSSCSPLFLFIQEVAQTEANPSTALSF